MTKHVFDAAFIQPLVHPLESWVRLRRRLSERFGAANGRAAPSAAVWHVEADHDPLFDGRVAGSKTLLDAYARLLGQVREFPCVSIPLARTAARIAERLPDAPSGFALGSAVYAVVSRGGEIVLVHLLSGTLDGESVRPEDRMPQRELRIWYRGALDGERALVERDLAGALEPLVGEDLAAGAFERLEPSLGHLFSICHEPSPFIVGALSRVHLVEEGTAADHGSLLFAHPAGSDRTFAHFGWSYSTVAGSDRGVLYRLLFPLIGVNLAWYGYRQLRGELIGLSRAIHTVTTDRDLIAQTEFYNQVVLDVHVWEAERESFERGLQPVFRSVHQHLWAYWDTGESRDTVREGIGHVRDFLDRKYSVKLALRESTQAKILFVIAIFQLLSVFGLISGYLYFWERTPLPEDLIYESPVAVWLTILSPFMVIALIVWLLVGFFRRHQ